MITHDYDLVMTSYVENIFFRSVNLQFEISSRTCSKSTFFVLCVFAEQVLKMTDLKVPFVWGNLECAESALYLLDVLKELGPEESRPPFPFTLSKVDKMMASTNYLCIFAKMTCLHNNMIRHDFIEMAKQRINVLWWYDSTTELKSAESLINNH